MSAISINIKNRIDSCNIIIFISFHFIALYHKSVFSIKTTLKYRNIQFDKS